MWDRLAKVFYKLNRDVKAYENAAIQIYREYKDSRDVIAFYTRNGELMQEMLIPIYDGVISELDSVSDDVSFSFDNYLNELNPYGDYEDVLQSLADNFVVMKKYDILTFKSYADKVKQGDIPQTLWQSTITVGEYHEIYKIFNGVRNADVNSLTYLMRYVGYTVT